MPAQLIIGLLLSVVLCAILVPALSSVAEKYSLVDKPDSRKQHIGDIPVIGGIAIYLAVLATMLVISPSWWTLAPLMAGFLLVAVGALDDMISLSARVRILVQIVAALVMVYAGQTVISSVGNIVGEGSVVLGGLTSVVFTVVCSVGVINAINMIDGVDGLSGIVTSIILVPLAGYAWLAGDTQSVLLLVSLLGALGVFLFYNSRVFRPKAVIFMGDAGSMFIGLFIVWYFVRTTQGDAAPLSPVSAGWIFGLPLVDTIAVIVRRVVNGQSPLAAGRDHFHHRLLAAGCSVNQTVGLIAILQVGFVIAGIVFNEFAGLEPVAFWVFVALVVVHYFATHRIIESVGRRVEQGATGWGNLPQ